VAKNIQQLLINHSEKFHPIVPFEKKDKLLLLDFSDRNTEMNTELWNNTDLFIDYINSKLEKSGAKYGIGGYAELRNFYARSKVFNTGDHEEPRRLHLGIDIWGKPYTKVMAPMDAIVHSFAFNDDYGDYGATIILTHQLEGLGFHTLYGHLSLNSIKNLREGDNIFKGDVFAEFGIPFENGSWPPHLHFQVITNMDRAKGDYPGVCKFSEKDSYLSNCPDPDLILRMMQYATSPL
jgi:peptidoglycan LD-endopeptidase LytH